MDLEALYAQEQERLRQLEGNPLRLELPQAPRMSFLDHAAPYLARGLSRFGPAVQPGAGHTAANIASVLAQGFLGGRASVSERMFEDYDRRRAEAMARHKEATGKRESEVKDQREGVRRAASDLAKWRTESGVITDEMVPFAGGRKAGDRVPISTFNAAMNDLNKSKEPKPTGAAAKPPDLNDYTGLITRVENDSDIRDFKIVRSAYSGIREAARNPSPAGDLSLIFAYMKIVDPGSTVREGEFATAQNTAGVPDRVRNAYNRAISGERLGVAQRADFVGQAGNLYRSRLTAYERARGQYRRLAINHGLDPELVVRDLAIDETPAPAAQGGWFQANKPKPMSAH